MVVLWLSSKPTEKRWVPLKNDIQIQAGLSVQLGFGFVLKGAIGYLVSG